jgi:hypothetical protein
MAVVKGGNGAVSPVTIAAGNAKIQEKETMTYPSGSGTISNNWGPAQPTANGGDAPVYPPTATPSAPGNLAPPQSPSGSVTNESATFNYAHGVTSTAEFLTDVIVVDSAQQGSPTLNAPNSFAGGSLPANAVNSYRWE